jgi:hypothetical protein
MTSTTPQRVDVAVLREIDLGHHHLFLMSDQSIDLIPSEEAPYVAESVLSLESCEAYRLMISLQEIFKEVCE